MKILAQSTIEYCVMIAVIVAAIMAMTVYTKMSLQGRIRAVADQVSYEGMYSPKTTLGSVNATRNIKVRKDIMEDLPEAYKNVAKHAGEDDGVDRVLAEIEAWQDSVQPDAAGEKKSITHSNITIDQNIERDETVFDVPAGG
jgi:hypothetical protein